VNILTGKGGWRQFQGRVYELEFLPERKLRKIHSTLNFFCFVVIWENSKNGIQYNSTDFQRNKRGQ
jgi:hypothetical protein